MTGQFVAPTKEELASVFPLVFTIDFSHRKVDRMAGFWEACGLETQILQTGAGYALVLHYPEVG